jgi:hypothetical protein
VLCACSASGLQSSQRELQPAAELQAHAKERLMDPTAMSSAGPNRTSARFRERARSLPTSPISGVAHTAPAFGLPAVREARHDFATPLTNPTAYDASATPSAPEEEEANQPSGAAEATPQPRDFAAGVEANLPLDYDTDVEFVGATPGLSTCPTVTPTETNLVPDSIRTSLRLHMLRRHQSWPCTIRYTTKSNGDGQQQKPLIDQHLLENHQGMQRLIEALAR